MENRGYQFEAAEASFDLLVKQSPAHSARTSSDSTTASTSKATGDGAMHTEATVKIRVGQTERHEVAEGDGPVNALDAALRKPSTVRSRTWPACTSSITKCA